MQRTVTLRAPASGFVLEKNVTAGQRIMAGEVLYRVADLSTVWVEGEVYEQDLRVIAVGGPVTKTIDQMAADFEKENPDIRIKPVYAGTYQESIVRALTAFKSGQPPHVGQ